MSEFTQYPRWLIDDTSGFSDARVFIVHLAAPRFVGELVPDDEAQAEILGGITIAAPYHQSIVRIEWIDEPVFDAQELCESLARAVRHHDAVRSG